MSKPTVGLISDLPWTEGVGRYGFLLERRLRQEFETELVYFDYPRRCLEVTRLEEARVVARTFRIPFLDSKPWFWIRLRSALPAYDITHLTSQNLSFMVPADGNAIVTCHDIAPVLMPGNPLARAVRHWLYSGMARAKTVITVSQTTATEIINYYGLPESKVHPTLEGVDRNVFHRLDRAECRQRLGLPPTSRIVLHVGIDKWRKNVPGLVKAMALLNRRVSDTILLRIGKASKSTLELIARLGLSQKVKHVGFCSDEDLCRYYNSADVLAFPSFYEGFGFPALEAMSCGTPVVAANRTSIPEVVDDAGILIDPDDPSALAEALERVLSDDRLVRGLIEKGLVRAQQLSWDNTAQATAEIYRGFISAQP